jgi:hypothetical protein
MDSLLSTVSHTIPVTVSLIGAYIYLLSNIDFLPIDYEFKFKFYTSIILGAISSLYLFTHMNFNFVSIIFGFILTFFIVKIFRLDNLDSYTSKNLINNIEIVEFIYDLKYNPKKFNEKKINKKLPMIKSLKNIRLKNYIYSLINRLKLPNLKLKMESYKRPVKLLVKSEGSK